MGIVRHGPPEDFILALAQRGGIRRFVETGTFQGDTALWASRHFEEVATVEAAPAIHRTTSERLAGHANIRCLLGDSGALMGQLVDPTKPTIFWLDAHYSGGETAGVEAECPLLAEIEAVAPHLDRQIILIDDARLFLAPPPRPHKPDHWANIAEVVEALRKHHPCYVCLFEDIIAAVPASMQDFVVELVRSRRR